ncbi:tea3 [Symbiodinium sp. KB8]|nr:tea3 [Symbiodinium sp. KB8]
MLLQEPSFDDRSLKAFVNCLADYNCGAPLGLVVPVITHTSPVIWDVQPTTIPLKRMNLGPFSFAESLKFFQGIAVEDLKSRRAISACGGHAALLVELYKFMKRSSGGLGSLFTCDRVQLYGDAVAATLQSDQSMSLLKPILFQQAVPEQTCRSYAQKGLVFLQKADSGGKKYRMSVPYPCFVKLLLVLRRPERFEHLWSDAPTLPSRDWSTKAFEALCAIRIAVEMEGFPYNSPCEWKEIEQFMNFTKQTGIKWAKSAGCNQIRAIFATGRVPRVYKSSQPTELEVDGVNISFTVYAKTANQGSSIQTIPISTWIPAGIMCF